MKIINFIGFGLGVIAMVLAWIWFGPKLPIVIFIALLGNNLERHGRKL